MDKVPFIVDMLLVRPVIDVVFAETLLSVVAKLLVKLVTLDVTDVISPSFAVIWVCKLLTAVATVDVPLYPVSVLSSSVISEVIVDISDSAVETLVVSCDNPVAFAAKPVDESVIAEFKVVIFTDVDMLASSLTPATNKILAAFDSMANSLESICDCNVVSTEEAAPEDVVDQEDPVHM